MFVFEENFKKGDYIISHASGDMAVYDKADDRGYMHFKYYYGGMFKELKDCKNFTLQINYQKLYELCNEEEKKQMDEIIKEKGGK